jgi:hypothetical protein
MRIRRQAVYDKLRTSGFLKSEARSLSGMSREARGTPAFKQMVNDRKKLLRKAQKEDISEYKYKFKVGEQYKKKLGDEISFNPKTGTLRLINGQKAKVFALYRNYEKTFPNPKESPWKKKRAVIAQAHSNTARNTISAKIENMNRILENPNLSEKRRQEIQYFRSVQIEKLNKLGTFHD